MLKSRKRLRGAVKCSCGPEPSTEGRVVRKAAAEQLDTITSAHDSRSDDRVYGSTSEMESPPSHVGPRVVDQRAMVDICC